MHNSLTACPNGTLLFYILSFEPVRGLKLFFASWWLDIGQNVPFKHCLHCLAL